MGDDGARRRPYAARVITGGEGAARGPRGRRPLALDVAAAAVAVLLELVVAPAVTGGLRPSPVAAVFVVLTWAAMTARCRAPRAALVATVLGAAAVTLVQGERTLVLVAALLALYSVALTASRRTTVLAWAGTAAGLVGAGALASLGTATIDLEPLAALPWTAVVAALGSALRDRRAYLAAVEERAERAERGREEEARRRVAEERVRIARDLHDVVAHHIAVIGVQAGVAQHLLATRPAEAGAALAHVRSAAAAVLGELGDVLSVLRQPGEPAERSAPAPGLARLDELVGSFTAAGLAVRWSSEGAPRELPATVDVVAYRVLEEALTNALKHGAGEASLTTAWSPASLVLRVVNAVPAPAGVGAPGHGADTLPERAGTGHGLLGMGERATAVGGRVRSGPTPDGRFVVEAVLPVRAHAETSGSSAGASVRTPGGAAA